MVEEYKMEFECVEEDGMFKTRPVKKAVGARRR